jgi:hypothetical protein
VLVQVFVNVYPTYSHLNLNLAPIVYVFDPPLGSTKLSKVTIAINTVPILSFAITLAFLAIDAVKEFAD